MSDEGSFSFSFNLAGSDEAEPPEPAAPLVALHEGEIITLNATTSLWVSKVNGKGFPLANFLLDPLRDCVVFRTVQAHVDDILPRLQGQADESTLKAIFQSLGDAGMLDDSLAFCARFNQSSVIESPTLAPSRVFILTCDRSVALERLFSSMATGDLGLHEAIYVLDDSRDAEEAERNRELTQAFSESASLDAHYVGASEKAEYLEKLVASEPIHEESIRFLLDRGQWPGHSTYGLARNWALALSAGKRCLMVDDDALSEAYQMPGVEPGASVAHLSRRVMAYESEAQCSSDLVRLDRDPLQLHAEHLGLDLRSSLAKRGIKSLSWDEVAWAAPNERYKLSPASPVLVTQSGYIGDPGCPLHPIFLTGDQRVVDALLAVDPDLRHSFGQRQFHIVQNRVIYTAKANMSLFTGLDNSRMIPPYMPVGRGEDALHGWLLHQLYPESRVMNFNWGTPHRPIESRGGAFTDEAVVPEISLGSLMGYVEGQTANWKQTDPELRLELLAATARDIAGWAPTAVAALLQAEINRQPAYLYQKISERMPYYAGYSPDFERYLEYASKEALTALQNPPSLAVGLGLGADMSDEEVAICVSARTIQLADALEAWPEIWGACKALGNEFK